MHAYRRSVADNSGPPIDMTVDTDGPNTTSESRARKTFLSDPCAPHLCVLSAGGYVIERSSTAGVSIDRRGPRARTHRAITF